MTSLYSHYYCVLIVWSIYFDSLSIHYLASFVFMGWLKRNWWSLVSILLMYLQIFVTRSHWMSCIGLWFFLILFLLPRICRSYKIYVFHLWCWLLRLVFRPFPSTYRWYRISYYTYLIHDYIFSLCLDQLWIYCLKIIQNWIFSINNNFYLLLWVSLFFQERVLLVHPILFFLFLIDLLSSYFHSWLLSYSSDSSL